MKKQILVVDDEKFIRTAIERILKLSGFEVTTRENGRDAMDAVRERRKNSGGFDLMITDVTMPIMTGVELVHTLAEKNALMPVLVMTGYGTEKAQAELDQYQAVGFIEKPYENEELLEKISALQKQQVTGSKF